VRNDTLATAMDRYLHAYSVAFSSRRNGNDERLQLRVAHEQAPTAIVALGMPVGCATNKPEMAWVRTDGRRIGDDADLLKQGHTDIAVCNANLDAGVVDQGGRDCMAKKGYALVRKDQAEQARAGYAASAPQHPTTPSAADR
jgi:hypothetical protein